MIRILALFIAHLLGMTLILCRPACALADADELILPGPNGVTFSFRPIYLKADDPIAGERFIIGDPSGDFRTTPTAVVVGGSFPSSDPRGAWMYYLGTYEVTEAQYDAVMGVKEGKSPRTSKLPITGISYMDAMRFTDTLNQWFYSNAIDKLPTAGTFPAYVRLPTEVEWEYAARGGATVDKLIFDAGLPYGEDEELAAFEWFSGPTSSHNKIQAVGQLRPNPLGLYDMLGNVSEMTMSMYFIEYYQGRSGGFVSRGGHYLTNEDKIHTALRTEEPLYLGNVKKGMKPNAKATMGIRLALAAPILTDRAAIQRIENAWETHRSGKGATMPAALSVAAVSTQEAVPAQDALSRLARVQEAVKKAGLGDALKADLAGTESALRSMVQIRKQADEDSARVWVKIAAERGMYLVNNLRGLAITREAPTENLRRRSEQFAYNVNTGLINYGEIMEELAKLPVEAVSKGFEAYSVWLQGKIKVAKNSANENTDAQVKDLDNQLAWLSVTQKHYEKMSKEKRTDASMWKMDYSGNHSN